MAYHAELFLTGKEESLTMMTPQPEPVMPVAASPGDTPTIMLPAVPPNIPAGEMWRFDKF